MKRFLIVVPVLLVATLAHADTTTCVDSDQLLANALDDARTTPDFFIEIVHGTYHLDDTVWHRFFAKDTKIAANAHLLGGFGDGCFGRDIAAGNTILTDDSATIEDGAIVQGDLTIEGITFELKHGLELDVDTSGAPKVTVRRSVFRGDNSSAAALAVIFDGGSSETGTLRIVNTLVYANVGVVADCAVSLSAQNGAAPAVQLINNTFVDNGNGGLCLYNRLGIQGSASYSVYNTILFNNNLGGNGTPSIYTDDSANLDLVDNVIDSHNWTGNPSQSGTLPGPPQLNGNFRPIEAPVSPVINSGTGSGVPGGLPSTDLDGGPRVVGSAVDRGAYESTINDSFVQTVDTTANGGTGSLRAAIANVDAHGSGLIAFAIPGGCSPAPVISLTTPLPAITVPVLINGYTQSGSSQNDLEVGDDAVQCVVLESGAVAATSALSTSGVGASAFIAGLAFSGFPDAALDLAEGSGHVVSGNHFGGSVSGRTLQANGIDIRLGTATHDVLIGGDDVAARNIIGDATGDAIEVDGSGSNVLVIGSNHNQIVNNLIGLGWNVNTSAYTNRGNTGRGVHLFGHDNTISGNVIGFNGNIGVDLDDLGAVNNLVEDNLIGTTRSNGNVGNGASGVRATNDAHDNAIRTNTIANNTTDGVRVVSGAHNKIRRNAIHDNGELGIDLAANGVLPNDDDGAIQVSGYANRGQNYPVLAAASGNPHSGFVSGSLTSTPGTYIVDFYANDACDASGNGEGGAFLRGVSVTIPTPQIGSQATATFSFPFAAPSVTLGDGSAITATATDQSGDTSEFSACRAYSLTGLFSDGFEDPPI